MTLRSHVIAVKDLGAGERVGYGGDWTAARPTRLAVAAVGYGDGYPRSLGSGTPVLVNGERAGLAGRVSMDMIGIDVTDLHRPAAPGDPVVLWGGVAGGGDRRLGEHHSLRTTLRHQPARGGHPALSFDGRMGPVQTWAVQRYSAVALAILSFSGLPIQALAACKLGKMAQLPVTMSNLKPIVTAQINGVDARFVADSGAFFRMITQAGAAQYNLKLGAAPFGLYIRGIGGTVEPRSRPSRFLPWQASPSTMSSFWLAAAPTARVRASGCWARTYFVSEMLSMTWHGASSA